MLGEQVMTKGMDSLKDRFHRFVGSKGIPEAQGKVRPNDANAVPSDIRTEDYTSEPDSDARLMVQQSLKYAEDMARVYEEERERRKALQQANERLQSEIRTRELMERALKEARDELERRVSERTEELSASNRRLELEVATRKRHEELISASLREKEVFLSEIHHRVKNNLQIISSLLALQCDRVTDPAVRDALMDSQNRIRSMGLIHEQLYKFVDLSRIDFSLYIDSLADALLRAHSRDVSRITVRSRVEHIFLPVGLALPCGLIVNELVTNCLKHAFRGDASGEVHIEFNRNPDGDYTLIVEDDGVGLPPDMDWRRTTSLGLRLVMNLVQIQLGGSIDVACGNGARFQITFRHRSHD
jgi:two-component sensor histidine kinase